jgi:hypothetical protein
VVSNEIKIHAEVQLVKQTETVTADEKTTAVAGSR